MPHYTDKILVDCPSGLRIWRKEWGQKQKVKRLRENSENNWTRYQESKKKKKSAASIAQIPGWYSKQVNSKEGRKKKKIPRKTTCILVKNEKIILRCELPPTSESNQVNCVLKPDSKETKQHSSEE